MADVPEGLKARGAALWVSLDSERDLAGGGADLALEACRIADRLDKLHESLIDPKRVWTYLRQQDALADGTHKYVVVMTGALAEARQQALVLRQIVAGLPLKDGGDDGSDAAAVAAIWGVST